MQLLKGAQYDTEPKPVVFWPTMVDVNTDIHQVEIKDEMTGEVSMKWQADTTRYSKDEYMQVLYEENNNLSQQIKMTQLALCDVYEMMI